MDPIKLLIIAADPENKCQQQNKEIQQIEEAIRLSKHRDRFEIIVKPAARVSDLRRALIEHEPQIVHISGYGYSDEGIVLEGKAGRPYLVPAEALSDLFAQFKDAVQCVVMNACYSEVQAEKIHKHVRYVVGMPQSIDYRASIDFAIGFYDSLGANKSFETAFDMGKVTVALEDYDESSIPVLKSRPNLEKDFSGNVPSKLELPEGQVPLGSPFYVERPPIESDCNETVVSPGSLIRIKAPRQMGKTSLLSRTLEHAAQQGFFTAILNFQSADTRLLNDLDLLLRWFCSNVTYALKLPNRVDEFWAEDFLGTKVCCGNYFEQYLLTEINQPLVIGLDEVDEVFKHFEVASDFLGLMRAWHENAKNNSIWKKLRLVLTHSKEVYIPLNINQSPFNVGLAKELPVFAEAQVINLAVRHGLPWDTAKIKTMMQLLGGHPFLVRVALYEIARKRLTLSDLCKIASTEEGPFQNHLRRHLLNLREDSELLQAARQVFATPDAVEIGSAQAFRLRSMGIVKPQGNKVAPLCDLYYRCFKSRLGA